MDRNQRHNLPSLINVQSPSPWPLARARNANQKNIFLRGLKQSKLNRWWSANANLHFLEGVVLSRVASKSSIPRKVLPGFTSIEKPLNTPYFHDVLLFQTSLSTPDVNCTNFQRKTNFKKLKRSNNSRWVFAGKLILSVILIALILSTYGKKITLSSPTPVKAYLNISL